MNKNINRKHMLHKEKYLINSITNKSKNSQFIFK